MNKRGVSKPVEAVLIILIVIAAISLLWWGVFIFLTGEALFIEDPTVQIKIEKSEFTSYDHNKGLLTLQTSRGADTAHIVGIKFIFTYGCGNTFEHIRYPALPPNTNRVYEYIVANYSDLIEIGVAPIYSFLGNNVTSKMTRSIDKIPYKDLTFSGNIPLGKKTLLKNYKATQWYPAGIPRQYMSWDQYLTFEVDYVKIIDGTIDQGVVNATVQGNVDYKVTKCSDTNGDPFEVCTPIKIGDIPGKCEDGIVKDYGDMEFDNQHHGEYFYDDDYRNCSNGNVYIGYFWGPARRNDYTTEINSKYYSMTGYGKYQICARYSDHSCCPSTEECMNIVVDYLQMDRVGEVTSGTYDFGDTLSFSVENVRTTWDDLPVSNSDLTTQICYFDSSYHSTYASDAGRSTALRLFSSTSNLEYFYFYYSVPPSHTPEVDRIKTSLQVPNSCSIRDTNAHVSMSTTSGYYAFQSEYCGVYYGLNDEHKTVYCCGVNWTENPSSLGYTADECSNVKVVNDYEIKIDVRINSTFDRTSYVYAYFDCPDEAMGSTTEEFFASGTHTDFFWVNQYGPTSGDNYHGALPGKLNLSSSPLSCENIPLNFCGKATSYIYLANYYELYGYKYSNDDYGRICVVGPNCPSDICS